MWVAGVALAAALPASALDFSQTQIADEEQVNRDATIGDAGLVAWIAYRTSDVSAVSAITDIMVWNRGERTSLGQEHSAMFYGSALPQVNGQDMVWIANYRQFGEHSFVLAEVPDRDQGATEIPALYKAFVNDVGDQWFVNLSEATNGVIVYTNQGVVVTNIIGTGESNQDQLRRHPSGDTEINLWRGTGEVVRITTDRRNDYAPSVWNGLVSWQKAKGWPFGWEIMMWETGKTWQLTTNFYYDLAPVVQGRQIAWYGWDGYDFEIFLYDGADGSTIQITSNRYDDVGPVLWEGQIAWEGFPSVEGDIFLWKDGQVRKISDNIEDDFNPRIWNGQVVWQGFDGDDFEVYLYDGSKTVKVTSNNHDDVKPDLRDGLFVWMGYEGNWDAEIYAWEGKGDPVRLTDNDDEDRDPRTAGGRIVWQVESLGKHQIWLAEPR